MHTSAKFKNMFVNCILDIVSFHKLDPINQSIISQLGAKRRQGIINSCYSRRERPGEERGGLSPPTPQSKQATAPSPRLTSGQGVDRVPSDRSNVGIGADMRVKALLLNRLSF